MNGRVYKLLRVNGFGRTRCTTVKYHPVMAWQRHTDLKLNGALADTNPRRCEPLRLPYKQTINTEELMFVSGSGLGAAGEALPRPRYCRQTARLLTARTDVWMIAPNSTLLTRINNNYFKPLNSVNGWPRACDSTRNHATTITVALQPTSRVINPDFTH